MEKEKIEQEKIILLRRIEDAFAEIPYPGNDNIFVKLHEDDCDYEKLDYDAFRGLHWKNLTLDFLSKHDIRAIHSYFTLQAFKYYLPGLMSLIIQYPKKTLEMEIRNSLLCKMTPYEYKTQTSYEEKFKNDANAITEAIIGSFSKNQVDVFYSFLEFVNKYYRYPCMESRSLKQYWRKWKKGSKRIK